MEKSEIKYSLKNIPVPSKKSYQLNLIDKIKSLVKHMRWRAFYYLKQQKCDHEIKASFGFKSGSIHHLVLILFLLKKIYQTW